jgi:hypothetical protein
MTTALLERDVEPDVEPVVDAPPPVQLRVRVAMPVTLKYVSSLASAPTGSAALAATASAGMDVSTLRLCRMDRCTPLIPERRTPAPSMNVSGIPASTCVRGAMPYAISGSNPH